jgi:hypothetical protein
MELCSVRRSIRARCFMHFRRFSVSNQGALKSKIFAFVEPANEGETIEAAHKRPEDRMRKCLQRIAHGYWYFAATAALCSLIFILGRQDVVASPCIALLVVSMGLILPQLFSLSDNPL